MYRSITEQLLYSTLRIETKYKDGARGTGTGYLFRFKDDKENNTHIPVIITNNHVVEDAIQLKFIFTKMDIEGNPIDKEHFGVEIEIESMKSYWVSHPDKRVDLCAIPVGPIINTARDKGQSLFYIPLDMSLIPSKSQLEDLSAMEDIVMIGYPNGIWDEVNNKPIFRKGVTATHPQYDYNGKKEFMIDIACFPGSSGSPVFILNEGGYRDKKGNMYMGRSRVLLMGTLYAGPQHTAKGEIKIIDVPVVQKPVSISTVPNNLGLVIKSDRIKELEKLF